MTRIERRGMTLTVPEDLQYSLLEFIAHINTKDYDNMLNDFVNLGFTPRGKEEQLRKSGITEGLAFAFRQVSMMTAMMMIIEQIMKMLMMM